MPRPSISEKKLQEELQYAIRHDHLILNRLIASRMPLCLPPKTDSPLRFALGLTVFGHLYTSFEYAWETLLSQTSKPPIYLLDLETDGISRHLRLSRDLHDLAHLLGTKASKRLQKLHKNTNYFHQDVFRLCEKKPYLILAWAWTMYLAIFNGGRFIRAELEKAGDDFWGTKNYPLEFWNFEGGDDGEKIHDAFKEHFDDAAEGLTREQKDEVIAEAKRIFHVCEEVVHVLDKKVGEEEGQQAVKALLGAVSPMMAVRAILKMCSKGWRAVVRKCTGRGRPGMLREEPPMSKKARMSS
ncbi:uncharacterized protein HMPREF1541_04223 [Cyphellophora europaea CBS 101466]|uniref:Heme oxygenase-like protein n=1 Tax=Cyphellophora europaea (strain CBS 101466) TaxID=1220924 RepID=W2S0S8_CYPE1|nr:uncharacterized protein HMPREF1541_04223 [Cyphellophora europaea CBS 101466]ETN42282.1 hypothetical protein HMPREF1541_04223 [Cyphellophora europaea CBS 101466]